jgi:thiol-disulfide isomerase/thioredoxin
MASTGVRAPFLHGLSASQIASQADLTSLERANEWLNSPPLTPSALRGKVVLIDFWTYTCINWRRTLPFVRAWAEKYKDQGLVVIGVHAPEFEFEKNIANVRWAVKEMRVDYPVAVEIKRVTLSLEHLHIDWIAVDPGNAAEPHAACTTGKAALRRDVGSGGRSKVSRTGWYRLSRSTGRFPAPRISRTSSMYGNCMAV